jgi:hypothetical protein
LHLVYACEKHETCESDNGSKFDSRCGLLDGFLDFAATETTGTDPNAFRLTVDQCPDWLEVGLEDPLGLVIGVTDVMAGLAAFATEIACICHGYTPSSSRFNARL